MVTSVADDAHEVSMGIFRELESKQCDRMKIYIEYVYLYALA